MTTDVSRRGFIMTTGAMAAGLALGGAADAAPKPGPFVCVFSKHLQFITDFKELAKKCKRMGLDGLDLTVRGGGHVLPENVATDLPRAVGEIRDAGLDVHMITTRLNDGGDPAARPILEAASKLGIRYFRVGGFKYSRDANPIDALPAFTEKLRGLAKVAADYGMTAGYHNHSGHNQFGAALWDLHQACRDINMDSFGSNFDVGHATVEGGYGVWHINARLMAPYVKMMAFKDFVWEDGRVRWVPLGQGYVKGVEFMKVFREAGFAGPISLHFEYKIESDQAMLKEIEQAVGPLRDILDKAGYA